MVSVWLCTREAGCETGSGGKRGMDGTHYRLSTDWIVVDERSGTVTLDGEPLRLTQMQFDILRAIMRTPRELVRYHELQPNRQADDHLSSTQSIRNRVKELRRLLGERRDVIVTHHGLGLSFDADVKRALLGIRRVAVSELSTQLRKGDALPGLPYHKLRERIASHPGVDHWIGRDATADVDPILFIKVARHSEGVTQVRRAAAISAYLVGTPASEVVLPVFRERLDDVPAYVAYARFGMDLRRFAQTRLSTMSEAERIELCLAIAEGLSLLHEHGVVHADIKPDNVLIDWPEDAKTPDIRLIDFAHAVVTRGPSLSSASSERELSRSLRGSGGPQTVRGSLDYIAPEIYDGELPDAGADVFSFGKLVFKIMSDGVGRPMPSGWAERIDDPTLREDIRAWTHEDRGERPKTAHQPAEALRRLAERREDREAHDDERLRRRRAEAALARSRQRRPFIALAVSALAVASISGLVFSYQTDRARNAETIARQSAEAERDAADEARRFLGTILETEDPRINAETDRNIDEAIRGADAQLRSGAISNPDTVMTVADMLTNIYWGSAAYDEFVSLARWQVDYSQGREQRLPAAGLVARLDLAEKLQLLQRFEEAAPVEREADLWFDALVEIDPELRQSYHYYKGKMAAFRIDDVEAREHLEVAMALLDDVNTAPARAIQTHAEYAQLLLRVGDADGALAVIDGLKGTSRDPDTLGQPGLLLLVDELTGLIQTQRGDLEAAVAALDRALVSVRVDYAGTEREAQILGRIAYLESGRGNVERAERLYGQAADYTCDELGEATALCRWFKVERAQQLTYLGSTQDAIAIFDAELGPLGEVYDIAGAAFPYPFALALIDADQLGRASQAAKSIDPVRAAKVVNDEHWPLRLKLLSSALEPGGEDPEIEALQNQLGELRIPERLWWEKRFKTAR